MTKTKSFAPIRDTLVNRVGAGIGLPPTSQRASDAWARAAIDYFFAPVPMPKPANGAKVPLVAVGTTLVGGFGDLLFGTKCARILADALPHAKVALWANDLGCDISEIDLNEEYGIEMYNSLAELRQKAGDPDVAVVGPARCFELVDSVRDVTRAHVLAISEYGRRMDPFVRWDNHVRWFETGLGEGQSGYLIDQELVDFDPINNRDAAWDQMGLTTRNALLRGRSSQQFDRTDALYFGYGHLAKNDTLWKLSVAAAKSPHTNVNILLVGDPDKHLGPNIEGRAWHRLGFANIKLLRMDHSEEFSTLQQKPVRQPDLSTPRTLHIICNPCMGHTTFGAAMRLAQPFRVVTGDQSFSEGISLQKTLLTYECQRWKKRSRKQYIGLAKSMGYRNLAKFLASSNPQRMARAANDSTTTRQAEQLHQEICRNHNASYRLSGAVKALLFLRSDKKIAQHQKTILNTVTPKNKAAPQVLADQLSKIDACTPQEA